MANREQKGMRAKSRPKAKKPRVPAAQSSPFVRAQGGGQVAAIAGKRKR
jgi:hypothetical protein